MARQTRLDAPDTFTPHHYTVVAIGALLLHPGDNISVVCLCLSVPKKSAWGSSL